MGKSKQQFIILYIILTTKFVLSKFEMRRDRCDKYMDLTNDIVSWRENNEHKGKFEFQRMNIASINGRGAELEIASITI